MQASTGQAPPRAAVRPSADGTAPRTVPVWAPLAWFAALAAVLALVVVVLVDSPGALDDPDPAHQRDGLLLDGPVVDEEVVGVEFGGRPVVLLFGREAPPADRLADYVAGLPQRVAVRLVLPAPTSADLPVPVVADPLGLLADAVDLPTPVDGGRAVGYAVVDSDRVVRYATIDPTYLRQRFEVSTIVGAVP